MYILALIYACEETFAVYMCVSVCVHSNSNNIITYVNYVPSVSTRFWKCILFCPLWDIQLSCVIKK